MKIQEKLPRTRASIRRTVFQVCHQYGFDNEVSNEISRKANISAPTSFDNLERKLISELHKVARDKCRIYRSVSLIMRKYKPSWEIAFLHAFLESERIDKALESLELYPELINAENQYGATPIHYAAINDSAELIKKFHSLGAEIDHVDCRPSTPLMDAAEVGSLRAVKELLKLGADPSLENSDGIMAIDIAYRRGHQDVVRELEKIKRLE